MQSKSLIIQSRIAARGHYRLDLNNTTPSELDAIRRLWGKGIIAREADYRTDSLVTFIPGPNSMGEGYYALT